MSMNPRRSLAAIAVSALLTTTIGATVVAQDERPFEGVTIDVITFTGPPISEPLQRYAGPWGEETGATINITTFPFSDLQQRALTDVVTGTNSFDLDRNFRSLNTVALSAWHGGHHSAAQ